MSAVIDKEKIYKPINGEEAVDLILNKFRDELVNSGMFPLHRTWHEFEFVGGVRVKGWSTKTEEVKFEVKQEIGPSRVQEMDLQHIEARVDVRLAPAPPSLLRESLPNIECPNNCGHAPFHSKESLKGHLNRWCKAPVKPAVDMTAEIINSGFDEPSPQPETDRHITRLEVCGDYAHGQVFLPDNVTEIHHYDRVSGLDAGKCDEKINCKE